MNRELYRLYQKLFNDVRGYFRYEAEPAKQRSYEIVMRETMRKIINQKERSETP